MVGSMSGSYPRAEVLPGPERRRRWSVAEKLAMVDETREAGATVSLVARRAVSHRTSSSRGDAWPNKGLWQRPKPRKRSSRHLPSEHSRI